MKTSWLALAQNLSTPISGEAEVLLPAVKRDVNFFTFTAGDLTEREVSSRFRYKELTPEFVWFAGQAPRVSVKWTCLVPYDRPPTPLRGFGAPTEALLNKHHALEFPHVYCLFIRQGKGQPGLLDVGENKGNILVARGRNDDLQYIISTWTKDGWVVGAQSLDSIGVFYMPLRLIIPKGTEQFILNDC